MRLLKCAFGRHNSLLQCRALLFDSPQRDTSLFFSSRVAGCRFFSLQKGAAAKELQKSAQHMRDFSAEWSDFADTAALLANLDLVISVDTAAAHLAGAMGKPIWLLNRFDSCWRWLLDRDDSPWYSRLRQFRQPAPGEWQPVIAAVAAALGREALME